MTPKLAIAVIHGIGKADPDFANPTSPNFVNGIATPVRRSFARTLGISEAEAMDALVIEPVYWAPVLQDLQDRLSQRLGVEQNLSKTLGLRDFVFHCLADSVGYQITPSDRTIYDDIHGCFAQTLHRLAQVAGPRAPLCILAHSMGSAIASNYLWDLQHQIARVAVGETPLEQGETFSLFYTFGSQIAFWSLRYEDFGTPIQVPSPHLQQHYPGLPSEWINFYDRDDLLGYPLQSINRQYAQVVKDYPVDVGNLVQRTTPLSHNQYWSAATVTERIAQGLVQVWQAIAP